MKLETKIAPANSMILITDLDSGEIPQNDLPSGRNRFLCRSGDCFSTRW
jgi:hypothetical protein